MSPFDRCRRLTGTNFGLDSYDKLQLGFREEKRPEIVATSSGSKFEKQRKHDETQKL